LYVVVHKFKDRRIGSRLEPLFRRNGSFSVDVFFPIEPKNILLVKPFWVTWSNGSFRSAVLINNWVSCLNWTDMYIGMWLQYTTTKLVGFLLEYAHAYRHTYVCMYLYDCTTTYILHKSINTCIHTSKLWPSSAKNKAVICMYTKHMYCVIKHVIKMPLPT
jgi:hypothetical protein